MSITPADEIKDKMNDIRRGYDKVQGDKADVIFNDNKKAIETDFQKQLKKAVEDMREDGKWFHFFYRPEISKNLQKTCGISDNDEYSVRVALGRRIISHIEEYGYKIRLLPNCTCPDYLEFSIDVG